MYLLTSPLIHQITSNLTFDQAAAIPVAVISVAYGLYGRPDTVPLRRGLGLTPFWAEGGRGKYAGQPIVIIGGASNVGQLGKPYAEIMAMLQVLTFAANSHTICPPVRVLSYYRDSIEAQCFLPSVARRDARRRSLGASSGGRESNHL